MTSSVNNKDALSGYKDGEALPPSTPVSPADASQKWTVAQKSDSSENQASISTEDKAAAAYSSITPILSPIPQKAGPLSGPLQALLRDDAPPRAFSEDKISRFFRECFSYAGMQIEGYQGLWTSQELEKEYMRILTPYTTSITASKTGRLFFSHALPGYFNFISTQCQRYGWIEMQFATEVPSAFQYGALAKAVRKKYITVFNALGTEYLQLQETLKEYDAVLIQLSQVKKDREDPCRSVLAFPAVLGSGELFFSKCFYQDTLLIEQFYRDYQHMLLYNAFYLSRFLRAIQNACAILES